MNASSRLLDAIKGLSEPVLAEVVDFAEFLRARQALPPATGSDEPLLTLAGGLEQSQIFGGDPIALQARMRDEWA